jgi:hypothetical protein
MAVSTNVRSAPTTDVRRSIVMEHQTSEPLCVNGSRGKSPFAYLHIILDEDGVGGGVVDQMQGVMAKNPLAAPSHSSDAIY